MAYHSLEPVSKQITIVVGLTVVGFMAFGLALSFYRNILFEDTLRTIGTENTRLQERINQSQADLEYYRSAQYKDKYAKENLGRLNPGEKILVIADQAPATYFSGEEQRAPSDEQDAAYQEYLRQLPVYLHWKIFLLERDKLEQLKNGF